MTKATKIHKIIEEDETEKVDNAYKNIVGSERNFIIKMLHRIEKCPRVESKFRSIISIVDKRMSNGESKDQELMTLRNQLSEFVDPKDARRKADFFNYENKFTYDTETF